MGVIINVSHLKNTKHRRDTSPRIIRPDDLHKSYNEQYSI